MKARASKTITLFTLIGGIEYEENSLNALRICCDKFHFDKVVCAVYKATDSIRDLLFSFRPDAELHEIGEVSHLMFYSYYISNKLNDVIDTEYVMLTQGDGFILNPDKWEEEFLNYDYIGSPWHTDVHRRVGNGGFCIRSKKFLEASAALKIDVKGFDHRGEDAVLCRDRAEYLEQHFKIKFAPVDLACRFGIEFYDVPEQKYINPNDPETYDTFGFHGRSNGAVIKKYENYFSQLEPSLRDVYPKYSMPDCGGDKGTAHSYIEVYEKFITKDPCDLLELGVYEGHSIAMWQELLPSSRIVGADIDLSRVRFDLSKSELISDDATLVGFADRFKDQSFDYVIDDASHQLNHQIYSFNHLYKKLKDGGYYFIEDIASESNLQEIVGFLTSYGLSSKYYVHKGNKKFDDTLIVILK